MDVRYIATTSDKLSELAVVNGQLIYLSDKNATYYDMGGSRRLVSSMRVVSALPSTSAAQESVIYGIVNDSGKVDASIWDASASTFRQLSGYKATANSLGIVQPDGVTITVDSNGVISSSAQTTSIAADHVTYDNSISGLSSTTAQGAIDEVKTLTDSAAASASSATAQAQSAAQDATAALTALTSKADKVAHATSGNFAGLDANGNLTDSGKKASDFTGKSFDGTSQEWDALSAAQKAEYAAGLVLINNDTANAMLVDSTPTENSNNLVKSGGVYAHRVVAGKQANTTLGFCATAEGSNNQASGNYSHAEGRLTAADAECAHSEGYTSLAKGNYSHAGGYWNLATKKAQTVIGKLNDYEEYTAADADGEYAFMIGNGTSNNARHNAFAVKWDGTHEMNGDVVIGQHYDSTQSQNVGSNLTVSGVVNVNGSDYAERFETLEDCPVGRFVTLDGEKIRLAQSGDDYILGVTSEAPAIVGDKDNPGIPVGLVGKLWVESDGTCKVNGFAVSGANGIATDGGSTGYRVMAVDGNRVKILVR